MIEVIYDNAGEEQQGEVQGIRLPKNIRQIGTPQGNRRIYVEDYVMTYLNQLAKPGSTYARGAILLGEYKQVENQGVLFISGALEAQNMELDLEEIEFNNEVWTNIYNEVKRYFPNLETAFHRLDLMTGVATEEDKTNIITVNANVDTTEETDGSTGTEASSGQGTAEDAAGDGTTNDSAAGSSAGSDATTSTPTTTAPTSDPAGTTSDPTTSTDGTSDTPVSAGMAPRYYTVQDGDTLSSISYTMYHSILYVDNIMEANEMKNGDEIYVGQQIIIPAIP